jgi:hypothetical protein
MRAAIHPIEMASSTIVVDAARSGVEPLTVQTTRSPIPTTPTPPSTKAIVTLSSNMISHCTAVLRRMKGNLTRASKRSMQVLLVKASEGA